VRPVTEPVRIALLGLGRMGRFHAAAIAGLTEVEVVALADPAPDARAFGAGLFPAAVTYPDPEQALDHPGVDGCLVSTPTPTHPGIVAAAIERGVHVLCEKPLALDPEVALELGRRAERAGLVLQVGFWRRYAPPWRAAKDWIGGGALGRPLLVRLSQWDADPPPASFCDPAVSGGLAVDCGVHEFDLAEWLLAARVERVRAWALPVVDDDLGAAGDLDNLVAVLELAGGAVATVDLSRNGRYGDDVRTEVLGSGGAVFVDLLPTGLARVGTRDGLVPLDGSACGDAMAEGVAAQMAAFARAVRGEHDPTGRPGAAASARATRIGWAVTEAARTGDAVEVAP
jgi:predicted dehydrogenase